MRTLLVLPVVATAFAMGAAASAQTADPLAPLERYIGTWTYEGDGNGARVSCRSERRWIANRSFVESHRECSTGTGPITQVEVYGFDPRRRLYVYWGFNGRVVSTYTAPAMDATVTWTGEAASATARCSETFAADGLSSRSQCEATVDGKTWSRVSGGSSTKAP
jgi:hypothetical protein